MVWGMVAGIGASLESCGFRKWLQIFPENVKKFYSKKRKEMTDSGRRQRAFQIYFPPLKRNQGCGTMKITFVG